MSLNVRCHYFARLCWAIGCPMRLGDRKLKESGEIRLCFGGEPRGFGLVQCTSHAARTSDIAVHS
eukprot:scaffold677721_cov43-Prasinocladus_malaysianus.AAC.1